MGRREDASSGEEGPEIWPRTHRVGQAEKFRRRLMRRRGLRSNALRSTRAMAGLRSQALGPAARSWLTGVASSTFSEARPAHR